MPSFCFCDRGFAFNDNIYALFCCLIHRIKQITSGVCASVTLRVVQPVLNHRVRLTSFHTHKCASFRVSVHCFCFCLKLLLLKKNIFLYPQMTIFPCQRAWFSFDKRLSLLKHFQFPKGNISLCLKSNFFFCLRRLTHSLSSSSFLFTH